MAVYEGHVDMVNALLAAGADKEAKDRVSGLGWGGVPTIGNGSRLSLNAVLLIPKAPELFEMPGATIQNIRSRILACSIRTQRCF